MLLKLLRLLFRPVEYGPSSFKTSQRSSMVSAICILAYFSGRAASFSSLLKLMMILTNLSLGACTAASEYPNEYIDQRNKWIKELTKPTTEPGPDISGPNCTRDSPPQPTVSVSQPEVSAKIDEFCGQTKYCNTELVSPVFMTDVNKKALGFYDSYDVNGDSDKLWLDLSFKKVEG